MTYSEYLRLESRAGGVNCSNVEFIRQAWKVLRPEAKKVDYREDRHKWLRYGLVYLDKSRRVYGMVS